MIAEDAVLLREGLAGLLEDAGHTVLARVGDAEALLAAVAEHDPDLAIVDVRMPPTFEDEGMRAAVDIRREHPSVGVLVLSQHVESRFALDLVSSGGGFGYLLKDRVLDVTDFLDAADRVSRGGSALDQIVDEVGAAIADMRQIAAGVRPARLDEWLAAALRDLARTAPVPVEVDAPSDRVSAGVEAAAYFVACEAVTNAVKHAHPSKVAVRALRENGTLYVTVSDDGVGGAVLRRGSGLAGLRDRVAAHGGTFEIVSPRGGGTRVEAVIPCES